MEAQGKYIWLETGHPSKSKKSISEKLKSVSAIVENAGRLVHSSREVVIMDKPTPEWAIIVDRDLFNSLKKSINSFIEG